jgi:hypothetical protein
MVRSFPACCAPAASGHAAAPPSPTMMQYRDRRRASASTTSGKGSVTMAVTSRATSDRVESSRTKFGDRHPPSQALRQGAIGPFMSQCHIGTVDPAPPVS